MRAGGQRAWDCVPKRPLLNGALQSLFAYNTLRFSSDSYHFIAFGFVSTSSLPLQLCKYPVDTILVSLSSFRLGVRENAYNYG
jgi:hypothetical protein